VLPGLGQAINLATSLVKFPQECLRADRFSAYNSAFNASNIEEALEFEQNNATGAVLQVSCIQTESECSFSGYCIRFVAVF
jgi:hypothetical protein